jgi:hypothetical protein
MENCVLNLSPVAGQRKTPASLLNRRRAVSLLLGGTAAAAVPIPFAIPHAVAQGPYKDLRFKVLRDGSEIGFHNVTFEGPPEKMTVRNQIRLAVRIAFITAFRYAHDGEETWQSGRIVSLRTNTDDNGPKYEVTGAPDGDKFRVIGPGGPFTTPGNLLTSGAVWHPQFVRQTTLINAEQGGEMGMSIRKMEEETVRAPGGTVPAQKYRLVTPTCGGFVWYESSGRWLRALVEIKGEKLTYEPV